MDDFSNRHALYIRIKLARSAAKLTQAQLAEHLGVNASAVGHWEVPNGSAPNWRHLYEIAAVTGCGIEWLATGTGVRGERGTAPPTGLGGEAEDLDPIDRRVIETLRRMGSRKRTALVQFIDRFCD